MIDGVVAEKPASDDQSKYINSLEIRLKSSENDVKNQEAEIISLRTKLEKQVYSPAVPRLTQDADSKKGRETGAARADTAEAALAKLQAEVQGLKKQVAEAETRAKTVQGELDDLLLVLGEMEEKAERYKDKIKSLGGEVSEDEGEEEQSCNYHIDSGQVMLKDYLHIRVILNS